MAWKNFITFHHTCHFAREVSIITDHKPTGGNFQERCGNIITKTTVNTPQNTPIVKIIHEPGPDLLISDWLSRQNNKADKDEVIAGMQVNVNTVETATNIPECMMIHELQHETALDSHLQQLKECIINKDKKI